jgi:hypothetical protein
MLTMSLIAKYANNIDIDIDTAADSVTAAHLKRGTETTSEMS